MGGLGLQEATSCPHPEIYPGRPYRDQGPGADELHISAEALPCQKALHVHMQLVPQCNQVLVLGLQPGRSGWSEESGCPPTATHSGCQTLCHSPDDSLLGLLIRRGHEEAHGGHGGLTARAAEHLPVGWLRRTHQLPLVTLVHGHLQKPELSSCMATHTSTPTAPPGSSHTPLPHCTSACL